MADKPPEPTREERLAAQLRANLRRRKEQARALRQVQDFRYPSQTDRG